MRKITLTLLVAAGLIGRLSLSAQNPTADWAPVDGHISTRWAASVNPENAHPEYPRPEMARKAWVNLNGLWNYRITPASATYESISEALADGSVPEGHILVPYPIESSLSGVGRTVSEEEALWYRREFTIPDSWKGKRVRLNFGAVDWQADVYVNGHHAGTHTGGFTSFTFDITDYLTEGTQSLAVRVYDATENDFQPRGKQVKKPDGIWYTAVTGIWQTVWLEPVGESAIADYNAVADIDEGTLTVTVNTCGMREGDVVKVSMLRARKGYDTSRPALFSVAKASGKPGESITLKPRRFSKWSPDEPYLHGLRITLWRDGKRIDKIQGYTAMRKISKERDAAGKLRMFLNNEALFQYGPLDQGWWPDGLYTAPTDEALKHDLIMTKEYGFNMIRKHIKVEPSRWFYYCDQLGILVWQDMPCFSDNRQSQWDFTHGYDAGTDFPATEEQKANYYKEWGEIISQVKKFPCIVAWVPFNENWSQFDTREAVEFTREADPTRLINMASGGNWVSGGCGDILDSHHYPGPHIWVWDPDMVVVLGEYGGIGLPLEGHTWQSDRNWGYVQYNSSEEVTKVYEDYAEKLGELVEEGVSAAVYTQTTDVEGEVNGLMTYDREVNKLIVDRVRAANEAVIARMKAQ